MNGDPVLRKLRSTPNSTASCQHFVFLSRVRPFLDLSRRQKLHIVLGQHPASLDGRIDLLWCRAGLEAGDNDLSHHISPKLVE